MSVEAEIDAATEKGKRMAAARLADDLDRLCCAETEKEFFDYVTERCGSVTALLRAYARNGEQSIMSENRVTILQQLVCDLSADLTDEGANYSTEGLQEMRRRVANALGREECPEWLHCYLDAEIIPFSRSPS
ncbi:hypothetical protein [Bradyrhizobium sp. USDA 4452]